MDNVIRSVGAALTCVICGSLSPAMAADNSAKNTAVSSAHAHTHTRSHSSIAHTSTHSAMVHANPAQLKSHGHPGVHTSAVVSTPALAPAPPLLTFSVISDIHLRAGLSDWGYEYRDGTAENKFATALQDLHAINPHSNAMVINGDLTVTGLPSDYVDVKRVLRHNPHPKDTLFSIGNHEFYAAYYDKSGKRNVRAFPNGVTEQVCVNRFLANTGMPALYYDRWINGYHFIVLGSEQSLIMNRKTGDGAYLSNRQLNWLKQKLEESPLNKPVFVFLHEPIPGSVAGTLKYDIRDAARFVSVLNAHPQVVLFTGHTHRTLKSPEADVYRSGFTLFNDSSVRSPSVSRHRYLTDSEGLYVKVYQNKVVVKSRDFTHHIWIHDYVVPVHTNYVHLMRSQP